MQRLHTVIVPNIQRLIMVFERAREYVSGPENDFMWSSWIDQEQAVGEIDGILAGLRAASRQPTEVGGPRLPSMSVLFAPTGPMQELALSSGWGDAFLDLAAEFDAAMALDDLPCARLSTYSRDLVTEQDLGSDRNYAEITGLRCPNCGQRWLRYFYENEAFTKSGRWYLGAVSHFPAAHEAKAALESLDWYFAGGSYFDGKVDKMSGPIHL